MDKDASTFTIILVATLFLFGLIVASDLDNKIQDLNTTDTTAVEEISVPLK